jgi:hypothetical protein
MRQGASSRFEEAHRPLQSLFGDTWASTSLVSPWSAPMLDGAADMYETDTMLVAQISLPSVCAEQISIQTQMESGV